jgi:TrmH family RNA methyltransferase
VGRVRLPVHEHTTFVLVRPHYPENLGACARAIKTMGFDSLALVRPSRLAVPEHPMAFKMSVRAWDVLAACRRFDSVEAAVGRATLVVGTSSRRGLTAPVTPRELAGRVVRAASEGRSTCILFGNEKTGLTAEELESVPLRLRIPMAGDQPSINLAQAVQLVAYELYVEALAARKLDA